MPATRRGTGGGEALRHRFRRCRRAVDLEYGYITTVLSAKERQRAGPKDGAQAAATVALDPLGGVSAVIDSLPQGQGHRTTAGAIIGDVFGLPPAAVRIAAALDTGRGARSFG